MTLSHCFIQHSLAAQMQRALLPQRICSADAAQVECNKVYAAQMQRNHFVHRVLAAHMQRALLEQHSCSADAARPVCSQSFSSATAARAARAAQLQRKCSTCCICAAVWYGVILALCRDGAFHNTFWIGLVVVNLIHTRHTKDLQIQVFHRYSIYPYKDPLIWRPLVGHLGSIDA